MCFTCKVKALLSSQTPTIWYKTLSDANWPLPYRQNQCKGMKWIFIIFYLFWSNFWICLQTIFSLNITLEIKYLEFFICRGYVLGLGSHFSWLFCKFDKTVKKRQKWDFKVFFSFLAQKRVKWLTIRKIQIYYLFF